MHGSPKHRRVGIGGGAGGLLLIAAPNPESSQFRALGKHWVHLDAPRHLHFLPASVIEEIGRANGLDTIERTADDHLAHILDDLGWVWELRRRSVPSSRLRLLLAKGLSRRYRKRDALSGAGFTLAMMR